MNNQKIELAKQFVECKKKAISKIRTCYHPNCTNKSINSHILQKNGILSSIATNNHLWEIGINPFKSPAFQPQKVGINKIFSFNCFCNQHDTSLFSKIEKSNIDFDDYQSCLLFIVRTYYNELFRKEVGIDQFNCLISKTQDPGMKKNLSDNIDQMKLAIKDLDFIKRLMWDDMNNNSESFVFKHREINKVDLIISSFYDHETTKEINDYRIQNNGKEMDRLSPIFITLFPYNGKTTLLMGYAKEDESKVKGYFNLFFKESEKRVQRKLTNLILFLCENWVCSEKFFLKKIKGKEIEIANTVSFSQNNIYERRIFDLNIFRDDFEKKLNKWNEKYGR